MFIVNLNNPLVHLARMMPILDAAAQVKDGFSVYTPHVSLFLGRPYPAYNSVAAVDGTLQRQTGFEAYDNLFTVFKDSLSEMLRQELVVEFQPPKFNIKWDVAKTLYHQGQWINPDIVTLYQYDQRISCVPPSVAAKIFNKLTNTYTVFNIITGVYVSRVIGAYNMVDCSEIPDELAEDVILMNPQILPTKAPPLKEVMQIISAAKLLVTNTLWATELAVGYGVPVVMLGTQASRWRHPYQELAVKPVIEPYLGPQCTEREKCGTTGACPGEGTPECIAYYDVNKAVQLIERMMS